MPPPPRGSNAPIARVFVVPPRTSTNTFVKGALRMTFSQQVAVRSASSVTNRVAWGARDWRS